MVYRQSVNSLQFKGGAWPTPEKELLLRAALLQGEPAINAWHDWKSNVDVDQLDVGSLRLLPLLYRNLRTHGVEDSLMNKFKGVYRFTWYKNQLLFNNMAVLLRSFQNAGIQTMILKGAALTLLHYRDHGLRPMGDFDVLIHTKQIAEAVNLLKELGWKPRIEPPKVFTERYTSIISRLEFNDVIGQGFDLHWHLLQECCCEDADDPFWDGAILTSLHNVSTYALNPTDQLLHICVHGATYHSAAPFRWVADAMTIINTSKTEIDWNRLSAYAQKHRLILPLRNALKYLRCIFSASVPTAVLQNMQVMPVSKAERIEYEAKARPTESLGPFRALWLHYIWLHYISYSRQMKSIGLLKRLIGFPVVLRDIWGLKHVWQLLFYVTVKGMRKILLIILAKSKSMVTRP
jgi:hypothetical protein